MTLETPQSLNGSDSRFPGKLTGRAFYESIGSPKMIVAPMVDRSEFAWRMLTRSYMDEESSKSLLAYTPMMHARLFTETPKFRDSHFQPTRESLTSKEKSPAPAHLDGNPAIDRPLFVQFCANKPDELLDAAQYVAPYCDAVDLNLGCPQGIARSGHYGAFLQEDWDTIYKLINTLHKELPIPVTAKMRILDTKERTLEYAKMILSAGAAILTVHGRRREQKGHNMGIADWSMIRYLRENLPPDTVLFANGNILNRSDLQPCLDATGADGIMSAEGNLSDPAIFAKPPSTSLQDREYWRGLNGQEGYRIDAVFRRYMDIVHHYILAAPPPTRKPLYISTDPPSPPLDPVTNPESLESTSEPPRKKRKQDRSSGVSSPSLKAMQGHLFQLLRPMLSIHTDIRDALAKCQAGDIAAFERVLSMTEEAIKGGLREDFQSQKAGDETSAETPPNGENDVDEKDVHPDSEESAATSSKTTIQKYRRPWWVCQPYIRPLPEEAVKMGALTVGKKEKTKQKAKTEVVQTEEIKEKPGPESESLGGQGNNDSPPGRERSNSLSNRQQQHHDGAPSVLSDEIPAQTPTPTAPSNEALVCG